MEDQLYRYFSPLLENPEQKIRLAFSIGGSMHTIQRFYQDPQISKEQVLAELTLLIEDLVHD